VRIIHGITLHQLSNSYFSLRNLLHCSYSHASDTHWFMLSESPTNMTVFPRHRRWSSARRTGGAGCTRRTGSTGASGTRRRAGRYGGSRRRRERTGTPTRCTAGTTRPRPTDPGTGRSLLLRSRHPAGGRPGRSPAPPSHYAVAMAPPGVLQAPWR
jgi:hypothetical protein